jgi:hypothetical protein
VKSVLWTIEEERVGLSQMLAAKESVWVIAKAVRMTCDCTREMLQRLGIEVVVPSENQPGTTSNLV